MKANEGNGAALPARCATQTLRSHCELLFHCEITIEAGTIPRRSRRCRSAYPTARPACRRYRFGLICPRMSRCPSQLTARDWWVGRLATFAVADLDVHGVDEDHRVDRTQGPVLPFGHALDRLVGDHRDRLPRDLSAIDLGQSRSLDASLRASNTTRPTRTKINYRSRKACLIEVARARDQGACGSPRRSTPREPSHHFTILREGRHRFPTSAIPEDY